MSETIIGSDVLPVTREPVRTAIRRMRWFRSAVHRYVDQLGHDLGCVFRVDDMKLAAIFVRWLQAVEAQKPRDPSARRDYFEFSAGLMLREMVADMPLKAEGVPTGVALRSAAVFWPEGYACTMFCLTVTSAALAQEFDEEAMIDPAIDDLGNWWSFRENAAEDPRFSIGFLDLLLGHEPNWLMPEIFSVRLRREIGSHPVPPRLTS